LTIGPKDSQWTVLSSWTGATHAGSFLARARSVEHCAELLCQARGLGLKVSFRGGGCSYSDSIVNRDGLVIATTALNAILDWQPQTGRLRVQAGATMADLLRCCLPDGWVAAGIPGSLNVTVGGAMANNSHGKDSCCRGNFGAHVRRFTLLNGRGELQEVTPEQPPELFRAVIGGLGLFGLVVEAELQLVRVRSPQVLVETRIGRSIGETIEHIEASRDWDYGQVWLDAYPSGTALGRGFAKLARYVEGPRAALAADLEKSLSVNDRLLGILPARATWRAGRWLFLPPAMPLVNWAYFQKATLEAKLVPAKTELFSKFYFFHNNIPDFYSAYRPPGFLEIQALLPKAKAAATLPELLRLAHRLDAVPVLSGMKRHLPDDFMLSFQGLGYSISFDLPLARRNRATLERSMRHLFAYIADAGGRVNLSKDETLPRDIFQTMYPRYADFWRLKAMHDPEGLFLCDMARRLLS
jgi:decaprenylphospho-beta-D-ribofuranose 2-oxidase